MPIKWREQIADPDKLAVDASLADKTSIVCHLGLIALSAGTGAWRVREAMNQVAHLLGVRCHVDVSLLGLECSCIEGKERCTQVVTLRTTGVNTDRLWRMESFVKRVCSPYEVAEVGEGATTSEGVRTSSLGEATERAEIRRGSEATERTEVARAGSPDSSDTTLLGQTMTVAEFHEQLSEIESRKGLYGSTKVGIAAACACGAFVFLLGGDLVEMLCAAIGAGFGNFTRSKMLGKSLNQMFSISVAVAVACLCYFASVVLLETLAGVSSQSEAGYIGAMLFVIPGFPLITSGLDFAKLDMRSGFERLGYALLVIFVATLVGWIAATIVGLSPGDLTPIPLGPAGLLAMRLVMTFVGVFGFSIMFNSPARMAATAGCVGAIGNTLRLELTDFGLFPEMSTFVGALVAGLLAWIVIRNAGKLHLPAFPRISITVPSIVIMVPGLFMYRAMYYMAIFDAVTAIDWGFRAALVIVFLPIGLALARIITDRRWRYCT